jgi:hypothetical protein
MVLTRSVGDILKTTSKIFLLLICPPLYLFKEEDKLNPGLKSFNCCSALHQTS